ncbi:MAG TPA: periplasmic heavy metal sensor [Polyangiaceae bacterium]|nr:periplasmic heavy metal sensor [Polyangiaceae bacterium]
MFGFLFGTACLLGLTATFARHHHERHYCAGGHRGRGFRFGRGRFILNRLLDRLDTTPGQEKVIREAVDTLFDEVRDARSELHATRADVAQAIRGETLDRGAIDGLFERQDRVIDRVRQNALDSFSKVHETLDERQRRILAELIEAGPFARGYGAFC